MILLEVIVPEWGLHQGDPPSPYLFLFCMEAFLRMLLNAQDVSHIRGIRASKNSPQINHMFFADDALFFVKNKINEVKAIMEILREFGKMSGLNGNSLCYHMSNISEKMVRDLWVPNSFAWNKDWVCELYGELVWDRICDLPIISNGLNDKVLPKIRVFAWTIGHELLHMNAKISSVKQNARQDYPRCGASEETVIHALKDYLKTNAILAFSGLGGRLIDKEHC
ncbi:hypothetical protein PVK06_025084 [Gossypium arboreum]|uniref:Reverse transcriptase domain-containing protein n=1 Tax=Gossypium arboreum TaxID=29729 RepID=A0ABR0PFU3_GOSAR|nr:hypothetical protein PVK06_025084 [Gossypium arboreum]